MINSALNGIATVASIAGFVGWLWQVSRKRGTQWTRWSTFLLAVVFLVMAGGSLSRFNEWHAVAVNVVPPIHIDPPPTTTHLEQAQTERPAERIPSPPPASSVHSVSVDIIDEHGQQVPQLVAITRDVLAAEGLKPVAGAGRFETAGTINRTAAAESDASMQGLITAKLRLHLRVVDTSTGVVVAALDTEERGGGFTADDAEAQAMQRVGEKIRSTLKLHQERQ